jgi:hypothetical protein
MERPVGRTTLTALGGRGSWAPEEDGDAGHHAGSTARASGDRVSVDDRAGDSGCETAELDHLD